MDSIPECLPMSPDSGSCHATQIELPNWDHWCSHFFLDMSPGKQVLLDTNNKKASLLLSPFTLGLSQSLSLTQASKLLLIWRKKALQPLLPQVHSRTSSAVWLCAYDMVTVSAFSRHHFGP